MPRNAIRSPYIRPRRGAGGLCREAGGRGNYETAGANEESACRTRNRGWEIGELHCFRPPVLLPYQRPLCDPPAAARRRPQPPDRPVVFSERVRASLIAAPPFTVTGRPVREVDQERAERGRGGPYCDYQPVSAPVFGHTLGGRGGGSGRWSGYRGRYLPSFLHGAPHSANRRLIHTPNTPKPTSSLPLVASPRPRFAVGERDDVGAITIFTLGGAFSISFALSLPCCRPGIYPRIRPFATMPRY